MTRIKIKFNKVVELFNEKTGDVVRVIRFRNLKAFNDFLDDFKAMRYPNYSWRYKNRVKKTESMNKASF
jgi:hypothetical protein